MTHSTEPTAIRIPSDTMEQEFQAQHRRGYEAGLAAARKPQEVRMLTEEERNEVLNSRWCDYENTVNVAVMIQRKFCEVNGLKLAATEPSAFKRVGTDLNEKPAEAA